LAAKLLIDESSVSKKKYLREKTASDNTYFLACRNDQQGGASDAEQDRCFQFLLRTWRWFKSTNSIMSFLQTVLDSIENPNHAGSQQDLSGLLSLAQTLPLGHGAQQNLQPVLGVLGSHLKDALNQQQQASGQAAVQQTVTNLSQPGIGLQELENLFGQERFNGLVDEISRRTGLNSQLILGFLPMAIPVLMKLLATGTHQTDPQAPNPVLNHFLGSDQNGGALLTEALQFASRFLH
jgi:hypothetical protein